MTDHAKMQIGLFSLRVSLGAFFLIWAIEKIASPSLAQRLFNSFYLGAPPSEVTIAMGVAQLLVVVAFLAGLWKTWTYGALLVMHAVFIASSWERLIHPYQPPNHLLWAAVPMLGGLIALFLLRDRDRMFNLAGRG